MSLIQFSKTLYLLSLQYTVHSTYTLGTEFIFYYQSSSIAKNIIQYNQGQFI